MFAPVPEKKGGAAEAAEAETGGKSADREKSVLFFIDSTGRKSPPL